MPEKADSHPAPGQAVMVSKVNERGEPVFSYPGVIARILATGVVIQASWTRPAMELGYTTFETGDQFTEWFYSDRWYNIMEVRDQRGRLKGWYCNVTRPAEIAPGAITYRDLILDLWVAPDGSTLTLDLDEFTENTTLDAEVRTEAQRALTDVQKHLARREAPFDTLGAQPG